MSKATLTLLGVGLLALLVACGGQPAVETTPAELEETAVAAAAQTAAAILPTTVAGAVATPFLTTPSARGTATPAVIISPMATITPTATSTPGTPTATPTLAPSASLLREAAALQEKLDAFREAVSAGDKAAVLKTQRELLNTIPEAEAAAAGDQSKGAGAFRSGLRDLRAALAGDLAKLESAAKNIAQVSGVTASRQQTPSAVARTNVEPIANLTKFAKDLADNVAAFQKAQDTGNVSDLLRLQHTLLAAVDSGQASLKNARTKDADTVRSALEDLANALAGDAVKFEVAQSKLRQVGASAGAEGTRTATATVRQVDIQPLANEVMNRLASYQHAVDNKNKEEIAEAAKALSDQIAKAQSAIANDQSAKAARLREALGPAREAAGGDQSKIDAAKSALQVITSGQ